MMSSSVFTALLLTVTIISYHEIDCQQQQRQAGLGGGGGNMRAPMNNAGGSPQGAGMIRILDKNSNRLVGLYNLATGVFTPSLPMTPQQMQQFQRQIQAQQRQQQPQQPGASAGLGSNGQSSSQTGTAAGGLESVQHSVKNRFASQAGQQTSASQSSASSDDDMDDYDDDSDFTGLTGGSSTKNKKKSQASAALPTSGRNFQSPNNNAGLSGQQNVNAMMRNRRQQQLALLRQQQQQQMARNRGGVMNQQQGRAQFGLGAQQRQQSQGLYPLNQGGVQQQTRQARNVQGFMGAGQAVGNRRQQRGFGGGVANNAMQNRQAVSARSVSPSFF